MPGEPLGSADAPHRWEASEVNTDTNWHVTLFGSAHNLSYLVFIAQVSGVQTEAVYTTFKAFKGKLVMEMDIGNQGNIDLFLDFSHRLSRISVGHCAADQFASGLFQFVDLFDRGFHVSSVSLGHGLDCDVRATAYLNAAHVDRLGCSTITHFVLSPTFGKRG